MINIHTNITQFLYTNIPTARSQLFLLIGELYTVFISSEVGVYLHTERGKEIRLGSKYLLHGWFDPLILIGCKCRKTNK